jgi:F-type H+-transporting ATPase subunit gamma
MANLKEIRTRISSVKSTQQVTSAMKMVSAAKLRKAQDAIIQMRPYAYELQKILANLTYNLESGIENQYTGRQNVKRVLLVAISSNRGLCGGFNSNIIKKVVELVNETYVNYARNKAVDIITIGRKASEGLKSKGISTDGSYDDLYEGLTFKKVSEVAQMIMDAYAQGTYDKVEIVYNQFKNAAVQQLTVEQFLPVNINTEDLEINGKTGNQVKPDYIYEPSAKAIVETVIPRSLKIQFYKAMLESVAAEHGARMTAMHIATDNASELLNQLRLTYNKARQAAITNEILEIVNGANALSS